MIDDLEAGGIKVTSLFDLATVQPLFARRTGVSNALWLLGRKMLQAMPQHK
jgi:hypothetical protein